MAKHHGKSCLKQVEKGLTDATYPIFTTCLLIVGAASTLLLGFIILTTLADWGIDGISNKNSAFYLQNLHIRFIKWAIPLVLFSLAPWPIVYRYFRNNSDDQNH